MSDQVSPKPGSAAALKQRHQAYQAVRALPEAIIEAGMASHSGMDRQAAEIVGSVLKAIEGNPAARGMAERLDPKSLREAKTDLAQYERFAKTQIDVVKLGQWSSTMDGSHETRIVIGRSPAGYHPAVETSRGGADDGPLSYGKPVPSQKSAEMMASRAETLWHNRYEGVSFSLRAGPEQARAIRPLADATLKAPSRGGDKAQGQRQRL